MGEFGKINITVKDAMLRANYTITRLAREARLQYKQAQGYVDNRIESVDLNVLSRICTTLKCNVSDVLEFIPPEEK